MKKQIRVTLLLFLLVVIIMAVIWKAGVFKPKSELLTAKVSFDRHLVVEFPTYGGYAPVIFYNRGLNSNSKSLFLEKQNLKVDLIVIDAPDTAVSAFVKGGSSGGTDIMSFTIDMYAATYKSLKEAGLDTVAILNTSWSYGGDAMAVSKEIQNLKDIKGKNIACAKITPSHYFALYTLNKAELSNNDVNWVFTQTAIDAANIFKAGKTDICVSWAPDIYRAAEGREGGHILISTKDTEKLIGDIFIVKREFAEKYPDVLSRFCKGWFDAVEMTKENPDYAAEYLAKAFNPAGIDLEAAKYMMSVVKFSGKEENLRFFEILQQDSNGSYRSIYNSSCILWKKFGIVDTFAPVESTYFTGHLNQLQNNNK